MIILNEIKDFIWLKQYVNFIYCNVIVQLLSRIWLFATPWTVACQDSLSVIMSQSLLKLTSIESMIRSNIFILRPPFNLARRQSLFQWVHCSHQVAKVLDLQLQYQSFQWIGWSSDLHAVQGTLQSLFQNHRMKASILWLSAFLMTQLSHPYMTVTESKLALLTPQQANESERQGAEARKRLQLGSQPTEKMAG